MDTLRTTSRLSVRNVTCGGISPAPLWAQAAARKKMHHTGSFRRIPTKQSTPATAVWNRTVRVAGPPKRRLASSGFLQAPFHGQFFGMLEQHVDVAQTVDVEIHPPRFGVVHQHLDQVFVRVGVHDADAAAVQEAVAAVQGPVFESRVDPLPGGLHGFDREGVGAALGDDEEFHRNTSEISDGSMVRLMLIRVNRGLAPAGPCNDWSS